jgi:hypothetical protein
MKHINVQQVNIEAILKNLTPHFKEEHLFFTKLSTILNKLLGKEPFNDEEHYLVSLEKPFPPP